MGDRLERWVVAQWRRRGLVYHALRPLAALVAREARRRRSRIVARGASGLRAPVVVVGNLVAGGSGKTPVAIALLQALQARGRKPGLISRGHGARARGVRAVHATTDPAIAGDEPVLVAIRTGVPMRVGVDRLAAARDLLTAHPDVDVVVSDDGLQHAGLPRDIELVLWDARGAGNGGVLPAGPLREPNDRARDIDLFVGCPIDHGLIGRDREGRTSFAWSVPIEPHGVRRLADWSPAGPRGSTAALSIAGRSVSAFAGIADPEKFFATLERAGAIVDRHPLADHAHFHARSFKGARHRIVVMTEKDAIKCVRIEALRDDPRLHVLPVDATLPDALVDYVLERLDGLETA